LRPPLGFAARRVLRRRDLLLLGQFLLNVMQVLQGFRLHSKPFSAIDRAPPGATIT